MPRLNRVDVERCSKDIIVPHQVSCLAFVGPYSRVFESLGNCQEGVVIGENIRESTTCCKVEISSCKRHRRSTKGSDRCFKECYVRILMIANSGERANARTSWYKARGTNTFNVKICFNVFQ